MTMLCRAVLDRSGRCGAATSCLWGNSSSCTIVLLRLAVTLPNDRRRLRAHRVLASAAQQIDELPNREFPFPDAPKALVELYGVALPAADALRAEIAGLFQVADDLPRCPLGNAYGQRNLEPGALRVTANVRQHQGVVGEKSPRWHGWRSFLRSGPRIAVPSYEVSRIMYSTSCVRSGRPVGRLAPQRIRMRRQKGSRTWPPGSSRSSSAIGASASFFRRAHRPPGRTCSSIGATSRGQDTRRSTKETP